ncbi:MAG: hypothetical protein A3B70_01090 [Deltaproteobacteria bacterium RIFCSPHIGHO2_02_FULL_40_11]|nr:MAG: hypothetical protein A3B70_01090 [Deltaproteobacteria bacterium RIFCSPHIGHO2_02_FULL_40_11]
MKKYFSLFIIITLLSPTPSFAKDNCEKFIDATPKTTVSVAQTPSRKKAYLITLVTWGAGMTLASQVSNQLSFLIGAAVMLLGSPILEPLTSKIRHIVFSAHQNKQGKIEPKLTKQWLQTQGSFSLNAQMSRNLHVEAIQTIQVHLTPELVVTLKKDPALGIQLIRDKLLSLSHTFQTYFEDIPEDDEEMASAIYEALIKHLDDPQILFPASEQNPYLTFWLAYNPQ